jgi:hypothetical protein
MLDPIHYTVKTTEYTLGAIRLANKLKKFLNINAVPIIYRTRAGYWQRSCGAWKWFVRTEDWLYYGSGETVKEIMKAKILHVDKAGEIYSK